MISGDDWNIGFGLVILPTSHQGYLMIFANPNQKSPILNRVGGIPTPLKNMKVSWENKIQNPSEKYESQ